MRKSRGLAIVFLSLLMTVCLSGCDMLQTLVSPDGNMSVITTEASHGVYQMNLDETRIVKVAYEMEGDTVEALVQSCIDALQQQPEDNAYKSIISGSVQVVDYTYDSAKRLVTLYFDPSYENLMPTKEILTRAAIVKTLTQYSEEIQYVSFVIGQVPMKEDNGSILMMRGRDFVSSIGGNAEYVREDYVTMYFVTEDGKKLQAEDVIVKYSSTINLETAVMDSLISGPISSQLKPALSSEVVVNKVTVKEGICYVDLNKAFLDRVDGQNFQLNIYSVVNTLTQIPGISRVQFWIDGEIFDGKVDGYRVDTLFEKDMSIVSRPGNR